MKKILLLSDMHCASSWGLWPKDMFVVDDRSGHKEQQHQTKTQAQIFKHWQSMLPKVKDVDCVILNGDLCDGPQYNTFGMGATTSDLSTQVEGCVQLLEMLPKVPMYFTQGSGYHTLQNIPLEKVIAQRMNGVFGDDLIVEECGIRMHVQHHISVSQSVWSYRTTPLARDQLLLALQETEERYGPIDICLRAHAHYFCAVYWRSSMGIITPCWKGRDMYAVKKGLVSCPDIGWVVLKIEDPKNICIDRSGIAHVVRPCKVVGRDKK